MADTKTIFGVLIAHQIRTFTDNIEARRALSNLDDEAKEAIRTYEAMIAVLRALALTEPAPSSPWFTWIASFSVRKVWVEDGFDLDSERALNMLAHDLSYANIGAELRAATIAAPNADRVATMQGYQSAADRDEEEAKRAGYKSAAEHAAEKAKWDRAAADLAEVE